MQRDGEVGMSRWFRLHHGLLDSFECQKLPPAIFVERFMAAVDGVENEFSEFVRPHSGRPDAREWRMLREATFARDDFTCTYCGTRGSKLECDHIVPIARGGSNEPDNLTTACRPCNRSKRDKLLEEWQ